MRKGTEGVLLAVGILSRRQESPLLDELAWEILGMDPTQECTCYSWWIPCRRHLA